VPSASAASHDASAWRVVALEFLVIVCEASDGLGASPGPPGLRRFWCWRARPLAAPYAACRPLPAMRLHSRQYTTQILLVKRLKCRNSQ
jgi:hypothetical protein